MSGTPMPPYVSTLRLIEEVTDPQMREIRRAYDEMMVELHAMTREQYIAYHVELGVLNPDGTPKLPEGDPIGMLDDVNVPTLLTTDFVDPRMRRQEIRAMTPEEFIRYQIKIGMRHPDGTLNWPEGPPIGMPYPGDSDP